jgi:hydrogenase expression/formation protein HypC
MCLAIPGRVEEITTEGDLRMGRVNFGGIVKRVCLDCVPEVEVGDFTIVHAGFAISKIDEESARETLALFQEMGALDEEFADEDQTMQRAAGLTQPACPDGSCADESTKSGSRLI